MDLGGISEQSALAVPPHRIMLPALFPKLIADLHVFFGQVVTVVMPGLLIETEVAGSTIQVSRNNVPCESALGQMIECRSSARTDKDAHR